MGNTGDPHRKNNKAPKTLHVNGLGKCVRLSRPSETGPQAPVRTDDWPCLPTHPASREGECGLEDLVPPGRSTPHLPADRVHPHRNPG